MLTWLQKRAAKYTGRSKKEVGGVLRERRRLQFYHQRCGRKKAYKSMNMKIEGNQKELDVMVTVKSVLPSIEHIRNTCLTVCAH